MPVLIIAGTIQIEAQYREQAISAMSTMMAATREEVGCRAYTFSQDLNEETLFHLYEEWESQEHLDAHFQAPHMAEFQAVIADLGERTVDISRFVVTSSGPL